MFFLEAETISKMWRICLNFYPPKTIKNMIFWAQNHPFPNFFNPPPNPNKMGVDRKHLELCNKDSQLLKNSTAQLFGHPKKPTQNTKERDRWTTMGHDIHPSPKVLGGWKCRKPPPDMGSLSSPCLGNPHNGYIRTPTYWVDDWWPFPICMVKFVLRGLLQ